MCARMIAFALTLLLGSVVMSKAETEFEEFQRVSDRIIWLLARMNDNLVPNQPRPLVPDSIPEWKTSGTDQELCTDIREAEVMIRRKKELLARKVLAHKDAWAAEFSSAVAMMQETQLSMLRNLYPERSDKCKAKA